VLPVTKDGEGEKEEAGHHDAGHGAHGGRPVDGRWGLQRCRLCRQRDENKAIEGLKLWSISVLSPTKLTFEHGLIDRTQQFHSN
jgi:hypothetical protein